MKNNFEYYKNAIKNKYAQFSGRARRSEYWYFILFNFLISIAISIVASLLGNDIKDLASGLYSLAVLVPTLAVGSRRLHDTGRSAWWLLLGLIPVIGWIILIVFFATESIPGDNKYGPNPKGVNSAAATV